MKNRTAILITMLLLGVLIGGSAVSLLNTYGFTNQEAYVLAPASVTGDPAETGSLGLIEDAYAVACLIKEGDYVRLAEWVHPGKGIFLVPSSLINTAHHLNFSAEAVRRFRTDNTLYLWGTTKAEGAPIKLKASGFFPQYLYDLNYAAAPVIGINRMVDEKRALENINEAFPQACYVELNYPSASDSQQGDKWESLILVFEEYGGERKLVALIHGESVD